MGKQVLNEDGEWRDGAASPKLLPNELRVLPSELVGRDVDDPDKAHELDAPHVIKSIVKDYGKAVTEAAQTKPETERTLVKKLWAPGPGERAPVRQWFVDVAKMRAIRVLVDRAVADYRAGLEPDLGVRHLWFPTTNVNEYELRKGNPPARKDRPKHLRDIDLVVDVTAPPDSIVEALREKGISVPPVSELLKEERLVTL